MSQVLPCSNQSTPLGKKLNKTLVHQISIGHQPKPKDCILGVFASCSWNYVCELVTTGQYQGLKKLKNIGKTFRIFYLTHFIRGHAKGALHEMISFTDQLKTKQNE